MTKHQRIFARTCSGTHGLCPIRCGLGDRTHTQNGKPYDKVWLAHDDIVGGGTLEFVVGAEPKNMGN